MHSHLAGYVSQNLVTIFKLHPEHRVRQWLDHRPLKNDRVFFRLRQCATSLRGTIGFDAHPRARRAEGLL